MKSKYIKQVFIIAILTYGVFLIFDDEITSIVSSRYSERGEEKFAAESVGSDTRLFEVSAVLESMSNTGLIQNIFGGGMSNIYLDVGSESGRKVHNTYANMLLTSGLLGLILYINIFVQIILKYIKTVRPIKNKPYEYTLYSMVFLALFWIFFGQGVIGGGTGLTLRGLVMFALALMINYLNEMKNKELYQNS